MTNTGDGFVEKLIKRNIRIFTPGELINDYVEDIVKFCVVETARYLIGVDINKSPFDNPDKFWRWVQDDIGVKYEDLLNQCGENK